MPLPLQLLAVAHTRTRLWRIHIERPCRSVRMRVAFQHSRTKKNLEPLTPTRACARGRTEAAWLARARLTCRIRRALPRSAAFAPLRRYCSLRLERDAEVVEPAAAAQHRPRERHHSERR